MNYGVKNKLKNKNTIIKTPILPTNQQASELLKHLHIKHYSNGTLELYNLIPDNVTMKAVLFDGNSFTDKEIIIPSYISNPKPTIIKTLYKDILFLALVSFIVITMKFGYAFIIDRLLYNIRI